MCLPVCGGLFSEIHGKLVGGLDQVLSVGARRLEAELMVWQDEQSIPHETRLQKLTLKMLGKRKNYSLEDSWG